MGRVRNGVITNVSASSLMSDSEVVINVKGLVVLPELNSQGLH